MENALAYKPSLRVVKDSESGLKNEDALPYSMGGPSSMI